MKYKFRQPIFTADGFIGYNDWGWIKHLVTGELQWIARQREPECTARYFGDDEMWTGLKDKNSKDIFEGDKVRLRKTDTEGYVIYSQKATKFAVRIYRKGYNLMESHLMSLINCEVIGNKWEDGE